MPIRKNTLAAVMAVSLVLLFFYKTPVIRNGKILVTDFIRSNENSTHSDYAKVKSVIDGDTIILENNVKVRYIGIDSPEILKDKNGKEIGQECFARESLDENKKLVEGKIVRLEKDVSEKDKYSRLLRYVYINDLFVNDYLLINGFASRMIIKPDTRNAALFSRSEKKAKEKRLGLWKSCGQTGSKKNKQSPN